MSGEELRAAITGVAEEIRDDLLTDDEAAALLRVTRWYIRRHRHKLAACGARYFRLPGGSGRREVWRWSRQSLLDLARTAEEQAEVHAGGRAN